MLVHLKKRLHRSHESDFDALSCARILVFHLSESFERKNHQKNSFFASPHLFTLSPTRSFISYTRFEIWLPYQCPYIRGKHRQSAIRTYTLFLIGLYGFFFAPRQRCALSCLSPPNPLHNFFFRILSFLPHPSTSSPHSPYFSGRLPHAFHPVRLLCPRRIFSSHSAFPLPKTRQKCTTHPVHTHSFFFSLKKKTKIPSDCNFKLNEPIFSISTALFYFTLF